jgi:hypothetical protein
MRVITSIPGRFRCLVRQNMNIALTQALVLGLALGFILQRGLFRSRQEK